MEEKPEKVERVEEVTAVKRVEQTRATARRRSSPTTLIIVAVCAVSCAALLFWWLNRSSSGSGRVVTAPRNIAFDQPRAAAGGTAAAPAPGEATLNVAPDVAARAGVKVEAVGEQLAPEAL